MWRYRELLPIDGEPTVGLHVGGTPLDQGRSAGQGARASRELYIKNDAVNHPTLSFKDRVVAVALSKAVEFGFRDSRLRLDGQPRGQRGGQRRRRRARGVHPDPRQPRAGQGPRRARSTGRR